MRNLGLDLLRIIAVLLVVGRHLHVTESSGTLLRAWHRGGWIGVDLFFVLSGFLVSSLLFREHIKHGIVDIKRFLIRRGFKIYPAFWLFLAFSVVARIWMHQTPSSTSIVSELLFLQNYLGGVWDHTWSLAVEEHFYIGLAALVTCLIALAPKSPFKWIPVAFVVIAITCLAFRVLNLFIHSEFSYRAFYFGTHFRIDSLMFGVLLSYLYSFKNFEKRTAHLPTPMLVAIGTLLLAPAFVYEIEKWKWISVFGVMMFYVGSGLLLMVALRLKTSDSVLLKPLAALGAASYSIYLWHMPVSTWGYTVISQLTGCENYLLYLLNAVVGSCLVGWILNQMIEAPVLKLRDRVCPSRTNALNTETNRPATVPSAVYPEALQVSR